MLSFVKVIICLESSNGVGVGEHREKSGLGSILFTCQEDKHNKKRQENLSPVKTLTIYFTKSGPYVTSLEYQPRTY